MKMERIVSSDPGRLPKKHNTAFNIRRKFEITIKFCLCIQVHLMWAQLWRHADIGYVKARILITRATYNLPMLAYKIPLSCGPTDSGTNRTANKTINSHSLSLSQHKHSRAIRAIARGFPHITTANCHVTRTNATNNWTRNRHDDQQHFRLPQQWQRNESPSTMYTYVWA